MVQIPRLPSSPSAADAREWENRFLLTQTSDTLLRLSDKWTFTTKDELGATFQLADTKWSDGVPLKAGDFVYAWKHLQQTNQYPAIENAFKCFDHAEAQDDKTLFVKFKTACPSFIHSLDSVRFGPQREDMKGSDTTPPNPDHLRSIGPYRITEWGKHIVLDANPYYKTPISLPTIELRASSEPDFSKSMIIVSRSAFATTPAHWKSEKYGSLEGILLRFPAQGSSVFENKYARRAFALATNRQDLKPLLPEGFQLEQTLPFLATSLHAVGFGFNPALAKVAFRQAGLSEPGQTPLITITTQEPALTSLADKMTSGWRTVLEIGSADTAAPIVTTPPHSKAKPPPAQRVEALILHQWRSETADLDTLYDLLLDPATPTKASLHSPREIAQWQQRILEDGAWVVPIAQRSYWVATSERITSLEVDAWGIPHLYSVNLSK